MKDDDEQTFSGIILLFKRLVVPFLRKLNCD